MEQSYLSNLSKYKLNKIISESISKFKEKLNISNFSFGCEVEFLADKDLKLIKNDIHKRHIDYNVDYDSYLYETQTPILKNHIEDWKNFKEVLNIIKNNGGYITDDMGGHIHFDQSIIKEENLVYFLKLWYSFEDIIYEFSYGESDHLRLNAYEYAKKLGEKLKSRINLYVNDKRRLGLFLLFNKEFGLNLNNHLMYSRQDNFIEDCKDTYEVRCPNGTLNELVWQNNVNFFASLFRFANDDNNKELIDAFYEAGKQRVTFKNALLLGDLIYSDSESKIDYVKQYKGEFRNNKKDK
ncbi:MAG: amidoligase family protein [Bacilli bacterium]